MISRTFLSRAGRLGLACLVACVCVISQTGCTGTAPTVEPVTIRFAHYSFDEEYYAGLVTSFAEVHPNVTVELLPGQPGYLGALLSEEPDVFAANWSDLRELQEQGEALALDTLVSGDRSFDLLDYYAGVSELFVAGGERWGIPAGGAPFVMFYNEELFDEAGVPYPEPGWTWSDFVAAAGAIRDPENGVFGYVSIPPEPVDALFFITQHGGEIVDDVHDPGHATFDDPLVIEAMEWYAGLYHDLDVAPTAAQVAEAAWEGDSDLQVVYDGIRSGRVGMWVGLLSNQDLGGVLQLRLGMVPLPQDAQAVTGVVVDGYAIAARTAHPDACWQWVAFISEQMPWRQMPARRSLAESREYEEQFGSQVAAVVRASMGSVINVFAVMDFRSGEPWEVFVDAVGEIVDDGVAPGEALSRAQGYVSD